MPVLSSHSPRVIAASLLLLVSTLLGLAGCSQESATPTATNSATRSTTDSDQSLTNAIHGIDAAIYGYGIVGAHLKGSEQNKAVRAVAALNRQRLAFMLAVGSQVDATAVAYEIPFPVTNNATAKKLAALLEVRLIPLFNAVVTSTNEPTKGTALIAKNKATARAAVWAGTTQSTPTPSASATR